MDEQDAGQAQSQLLSEDSFLAHGSQVTGYSGEQLLLLQSITGANDDAGNLEDEIEDEDNDSYTMPAQTYKHPRSAFDIAAMAARATVLSKRQLDAFTSTNFLELGHELVREEIKVYTTLHNKNATELLRMTSGDIVASTQEPILAGLLAGDLPKAYARCEITISALDRLYRLAGQQPVIYAQWFADKNGDTPTVEDWMGAFALIVEYCKGEDPEVIIAFDNFKFNTTREQAQNKERRYFKNRSGKAVKKVLVSWAHKLQKRLIAVEDQSEALFPTLMEFGYTRYAAKRLEQHRKHQSSNLLLNLADCALYIHCEGKYSLKQAVIYHIWEPEQAVVAEILFTRLGGGYTEDAAGFNAYPAGRSNTSAYAIDLASWEEIMGRAIQDSPYLANMQAIVDRANEEAEDELAFMEDWNRTMQEKAQVDKELKELETRNQEVAKAWDEEVERAMELLLFGPE